MKKENKIFWIIGLILVGLLLFKYSQPFVVIPSGYDFHTESSLISQDSNSTTYSFSYITDGPTGAFPTCSDPVQEESIDFIATSHPTSQPALPPFVEGLQTNVNFPGINPQVSPLLAQQGSECNPSPGWDTQYNAIYEDTGTECWINQEGEYGAVSCQFRGTVKAYNSSGEQVPAVFGWVTTLNANVQILMEGIICLTGQERCDEMNYSICENGNYTNQGLVDGECGYTLVCSDGEEDCDGLNYRICSNNEWISQGEVIGHCGITNGTEQPRVYYRFSNNSCTQISMLPSLKTINDYNTLAICQSHILGGGQTNQTCWSIINKVCTSEVFNVTCPSTHYSSQTICEDNLGPLNYDTWILIGGIILIIGVIYLTRRKR